LPVLRERQGRGGWIPALALFADFIFFDFVPDGRDALNVEPYGTQVVVGHVA
jgi:hypothetical protein